MTKDEIIKLAREAGLCNEFGGIEGDSGAFYDYRDELEAFARACYEAGRTVEREECAKVAEDLFASTGRTFDHRAIAAAIRARGKP